MTILVTGSAGHLGEALMRTLRAAGREARGIDLKTSPFTDAAGSITDRKFLGTVFDGVTAVIHAAALHKPHVASHSRQDFVDTNVTGTVALLEAAQEAGTKAFVFTSTTSAFGAALTPTPGAPAAWIAEDVAPVPKNIYGATKTAAETLCELFARRHGLPALVLRASRFFPEPDDDPEQRARHTPDNAQANELLFRRADIEDVVAAHLLAVERAPALGFGRYIVSATTPFSQTDLSELRRDAATVVSRLYPESAALYAARGWSMSGSIDRVYVNAAARRDLGWRPRCDFAHVLDCLRAGCDFRSELARQIGAKGYHGEAFASGPYPT